MGERARARSFARGGRADPDRPGRGDDRGRAEGDGDRRQRSDERRPDRRAGAPEQERRRGSFRLGGRGVPLFGGLSGEIARARTSFRLVRRDRQMALSGGELGQSAARAQARELAQDAGDDDAQGGAAAAAAGRGGRGRGDAGADGGQSQPAGRLHGADGGGLSGLAQGPRGAGRGADLGGGGGLVDAGADRGRACDPPRDGEGDRRRRRWWRGHRPPSVSASRCPRPVPGRIQADRDRGGSAGFGARGCLRDRGVRFGGRRGGLRDRRP